MSDYTIVTDRGCDLPTEKLAEWGVKWVDMSFRFEGEDIEYGSDDMDSAAFYQKMRDGGCARTAGTNGEVFRDVFEQELQAGRDVLYLGFSSGLSGMVGNAYMAAEEAEQAYPGRRVIAIDTLCASLGQGMMIYLTVREKQKGCSLEEAAAFVRENAPRMAHWFTVGDLAYLKRSGRLSAAAAFAAGVLNIKPVMHMDEEGRLVVVGKIRGMKQALKRLADQYAALAVNPSDEYFICHSDCIDDARQLEAFVAEKAGHGAALIGGIGPVIGSHCGPGTLAVFFISRER